LAADRAALAGEAETYALALGQESYLMVRTICATATHRSQVALAVVKERRQLADGSKQFYHDLGHPACTSSSLSMIRSTSTRTAAYIVLLALTACNAFEAALVAPYSDPDDSDAITAPVLANAGPDRKVLRGYWVDLDGSGSYHPSGKSFTVTWTQLEGPTMVFNPKALQPRFTAPLEPMTLRFRLTADDGDWITTDDVTLHVTNEAWSGVPIVRAAADRYLDYGESAELTDEQLAAKVTGVSPADSTVAWRRVVPSPVLGTDEPDEQFWQATIYAAEATFGELSSEPDYLLMWLYDNERPGAQAPTCTLPALEPVGANGPVEIDASGCSDANSEPVYWRWTQLQGARVLSEQRSGSKLTFIAPAEPQHLVLRFTARDALLESVPIDVVLEVGSNGLGKPIVAPPREVRTHAGNEVSVAAIADLTTTTVGFTTYEWDQTVGPEITLSWTSYGQVVGFVAPAFAEPDVQLGLAVIANRYSVASAPDVTRVTVVAPSDNGPPLIQLCVTSTTGSSDSTVGVRVRLFDQEFDTLSWLQWSGATITAGTSGISDEACPPLARTTARLADTVDTPLEGTFTMPANGVTLTFTACDVLEGCDSQSIEIATAL
jgi:hypothetical protein